MIKNVSAYFVLFILIFITNINPVCASDNKAPTATRFSPFTCEFLFSANWPIRPTNFENMSINPGITVAMVNFRIVDEINSFLPPKIISTGVDGVVSIKQSGFAYLLFQFNDGTVTQLDDFAEVFLPTISIDSRIVEAGGEKKKLLAITGIAKKFTISGTPPLVHVSLLEDSKEHLPVVYPSHFYFTTDKGPGEANYSEHVDDVIVCEHFEDELEGASPLCNKVYFVPNCSKKNRS